MPILRIECPGTVFPSGVFNPGDGATTGTWADDSDATWSEGGDNEAVLEEVPHSVPADLSRVAVTAHVRYSGASPGQVAVNDAALDDTILGVNVLPGGAAAVPTWTSVEMTGDIGNFLTRIFGVTGEVGGDLVLIVVGDQKVYEAHVTIRVPGEAPPCRVFPADTLGAVGGPVRQFPPSKSRQRSNRGVGYY